MSAAGLRGALEHFLDLCLPPACAGCGDHLSRPDRPRICPRCQTRLRPPPHPRCSRCDAPIGTGLPADRPCAECHDWPPILGRARSAVVLRPPADVLVHALKYGGWRELAREMAAPMIGLCRADPGRLQGLPVIPVPTTPDRLRRRGYNQARELALEVARGTGGVLVEALARREGGGSQVTLHRGDRRANVEGAFHLREEEGDELRDRQVLLVDDVLTTGATACAAANVLAGAGVRNVVLLTFARALPG